MAKVKGKYINMNKSADRRERIEEQIHKFSLVENYTRFEAVEGNADEAKFKGLSSGELGIWQSWLKLLKVENQKGIKDYDYLHIMEDDIVITDDLIKMCEQLDGKKPRPEIIATDMYVNPFISFQIVGQASMVHSLIEAYDILKYMR